LREDSGKPHHSKEGGSTPEEAGLEAGGQSIFSLGRSGFATPEIAKRLSPEEDQARGDRDCFLIYDEMSCSLERNA
jgi:hypothetical protein